MPNALAEKLTAINQQQLQVSWEFKLPRIQRIKKYRRLYNTEVPPKLRTQFNVPLPVFAGMIDTLQADLDDALLLKFRAQDPADWKAAQKANAYLEKESTSMRPGAQWNKKFRQARQESIITGRGILKYAVGNEEGNYYSCLDSVPFEDFFFEPLGGGSLENHLFAGQQNIWMTESQLRKGVENGIYDKTQVNKLVADGGMNYKSSGVWDGNMDFANRFAPLGLNTETNNYVGEKVFHLVEWVSEFQGRRWYNLYDAYSGTWIRFDKWEEICSSEYLPWMSFASHEDAKNFASKSFADDLYPIADSVITLFNQELTNRQKRNLNAKMYDKDMIKDVQKLDEAQYRPDALVPVDTKGGTRKLSEGVYAFQTPELTGTINMVDWLTESSGRQLGVNELQQGQSQAATKKVGVAYAELAQVSKRLSFMSQPFIEVGQELGLRVVGGLKDYMTEPIAVELLGEDGVEWDVFRRLDLNTKKDLEITVSSQAMENKTNERAKANKAKALELTAGSQNVNQKARDEFIFREIGEFSESEIAVLLDTKTESDKETQAEVSAAIQEIVLRNKKPSLNWNADRYFIRKILDFAKKHKDTLTDKKYKLLMECAEEHMEIAAKNAEEQAVNDVRIEQDSMMRAGLPTDEVPVEDPSSSGAIPIPTMKNG